MSPLGRTRLYWWFTVLNLQWQPHAAWHQDRLREELFERRLVENGWEELSEASNVLFLITRAQYDGFPTRNPPCLSGLRSGPIYTLAAPFCNARDWNLVNEVGKTANSLKWLPARDDQMDFLLPFLITSTSSEFTMQPSGVMHSNACPNVNEAQSSQGGVTNRAKPAIIGLFGLPGSEKILWLDTLQTALGNDDFAVYDDSDIIAAEIPGGLQAFQNLDEKAKRHCRQLAVARIKQECCSTGKSAIVVGHCMVWPEPNQVSQSGYAPGDLAMYTHILYLDVHAAIIAENEAHDTNQNRPKPSISNFAAWQSFEIDTLRDLCRYHDILFTVVSPQLESVSKLGCIIRDFRTHSEAYNENLAVQRMGEILTDPDRLRTVIVLDADRILAREDSGVLFWEQLWEEVHATEAQGDGNSPLKALFDSPLGYSYTAFRQATLLYEEILGDVEFEACCETVSSLIHMHGDIRHLLQSVGRTKHVQAVVVTCGIRSVWEKVLEREGLSDKIKVIGGGRLRDGLVVTPSVKAELVRNLSTVQGLYVFAFGDSPFDLEMLKAANEAIVVTGEDTTESWIMKYELAEDIGKNGFQARQVALPHHAAPLLDSTQLPSVRLTDPRFIDWVLAIYQRPYVLHATDRPSAKLLMTPMRNASVSGPALREAHRRVGYYLAVEFCTEIIGFEGYPIPHVQGFQTDGYRLLNEKETLIVPLMRGGEAMAVGVNDAFPLCTFHHAEIPNDIQPETLKNMATIILVDSVVNTGNLLLAFVQHIRRLNATIRIVVVAGVIHPPAISTGKVACTLGRITGLYFVALRFSANQVTATGITDTANRLFNTVDMD
ncbi:unnamed protein product [Penicillium viridicatum]